MSRKLTLWRLVSISIWNPIALITFLMFFLILSVCCLLSIDLLIFPSTFFEGFFIKRQVGLLVKLSLWSFSVVNNSALGRRSILYAKLIFFAMFLASRLIDISNFVGAFFYKYVILFLISFSWSLGYILYVVSLVSKNEHLTWLFDLQYIWF